MLTPVEVGGFPSPPRPWTPSWAPSSYLAAWCHAAWCHAEKKRKEKKRKEKKRKEKKRKEKKRKEKKRKEKKRKEKKRLEKTTPFGVNLMRSQVSYRAAQAQRLTSSAETAADCGSDSEAWCACLTVRATAYGCLLQYFSNGFSCDCMVLLQAVQGCFLFIWKSASTYFCRCL